MTNPTVDVSTGLTILFGTTGFEAEILDVTLPSVARESINTSHQGTTGAHTFTPASLYDAGEFSFTMHFDPSKTPPWDQDAETITLTFPSTATWIFTAFLTGYDGEAPLEDKMTASGTLKISGAIDVNASS
jgi:hypothetical protein